MFSWKTLVKPKEIKKASVKSLRVLTNNQVIFESFEKILNLHKKISMENWFLPIFICFSHRFQILHS